MTLVFTELLSIYAHHTTTMLKYNNEFPNQQKSTEIISITLEQQLHNNNCNGLRGPGEEVQQIQKYEILLRTTLCTLRIKAGKV